MKKEEKKKEHKAHEIMKAGLGTKELFKSKKVREKIDGKIKVKRMKDE